MLKNILRVLSLLLVGWLGYLFMPTMAYGYYDISVLILIFGIMLGFIEVITTDEKFKIPAIVTSIGFLMLTVIPFLTSAPIMFHSDDYRNVIGNIETSNFTKDVAPVDINKVRIIDEAMAEKIGSKILGEDPSLGSRAKLGEFNIQQVKGNLYWVAPLIHKGFFKWFNKPQGTPGYVMVSASNERDVKLVQRVNGQDIFLKYQKGAYFGDNLHRHVYLNGYMSKGITDFSFEIDDDMNPFYVVTIFEKTVGFEGSNATGVVVVNPQTGKMIEYSIEDAPKWIDRIQPSDFIVNQLDNWGQYIDGWWNATFTQDGVLKTSDGISLVYGSDGKSYWYTGMTSVGKDGSTVGFTLVNTRTKKTYWYKQAGATEKRGMASAEGMVQEKGYNATAPILYNIAGIPTYIMSLKDNEGLIKMISMVSVENYSVVGIGKDVKSALRSYKSALSSKGNIVSIDSLTDSVKIESIIFRIDRDIRNGDTLYYLQVESNPNKIFIVDSTMSEKIVLTQIGDEVIIAFEEAGSGFINLNYFDNKSLNLDKKSEQIKKEKQYKKLQVKKVEKHTEKEWENLTPKQKSDLMKSLK